MAPEDSAQTQDSVVGPPGRGPQDSASANDFVGPAPHQAPYFPPGFPRSPFGPFPAIPNPKEQDRIGTEEAERVRDYMREKFPKSPPCPWCGHDDFECSQICFLYPRVAGPNSTKVYPVFQLICTTCGYTQLFNAAITGLVSSAQPVERPESDPT